MKLSVLLGTAPLLLILALVQSGCKTVCDSIPTERAPQLRIINAMPDEANVKIYIGDKLVSPAYPYSLPADFGYHDKYADGSFLRIAAKQKLVVLSASADTLIKDSITLNNHRHTLFILGRGLASFASTRKIILFDDELTAPPLPDDTISLVRFVHAITDLSSLDVYFSDNVKQGDIPDFTLAYGDTLNFYHRIQSLKALTVTEHNSPAHVIVSFHGFPVRGFLATILLRGETNQYGMDPLVSVNILSESPIGQSLTDFHTFGVRLVNATRGRTVTLMLKGPGDSLPRTNIQGQQVVMFIPPDSASDWAPFNPKTHGRAAGSPILWIFGNWHYPVVDSFYWFNFGADANVRYSLVAMDTAPLLSGKEQLDSMILTDTIATPPATMGRVRFANFSPDHAVNFTIDSHSVTLKIRDVVVLDIKPGHYTTTETSTGKQLDFTVPAGTPEAVFFYPTTTANALPYSVAKE